MSFSPTCCKFTGFEGWAAKSGRSWGLINMTEALAPGGFSSSIHRTLRGRGRSSSGAVLHRCITKSRQCWSPAESFSLLFNTQQHSWSWEVFHPLFQTDPFAPWCPSKSSSSKAVPGKQKLPVLLTTCQHQLLLDQTPPGCLEEGSWEKKKLTA